MSLIVRTLWSECLNKLFLISDNFVKGAPGRLENTSRNQKFNFLRDLLILPMKEIREKDYKHSLKQKTQIKMSNMDMKILINKNKKIPHKKGKFINYKNKTDVVLPSFTKKLFRVALNK